LSLLLGAVLVTLAAAFFTRSDIALAAQAACDLALASYISLLVRAARPSVGAGAGRRDAAVHPLAPDPGWAVVYADWPALEEPVGLPVQLPEAAPDVVIYVPAHALRQAAQPLETSDADESYGDFDSYASLALANAR